MSRRAKWAAAVLAAGVLIAGIAPVTAQQGGTDRGRRPGSQPPSGNVVFVTAGQAPVRADASPAAPVVAQVTRGTRLDVLGQAGGTRLRVRLPDGRQGFIAAVNVSRTPPAGAGTQTADAGGLLRDNRGAREQAGYSSARGLSPGGERVARQQGASQDAQDEVTRTIELSNSINEREIDAFMAEGGVTPP